MTNILTISSGNLSILKDKVLEEESDYEAILKRIKTIENSLQRLENMAYGLKNYGRAVVNNENCSINKSLDNIFLMVKDIYYKEGIQISLPDEAAEFFVKGASVNLQQIFLVLLNLARDFKKEVASSHSKLKVVLEKSGNNIVLGFNLFINSSEPDHYKKMQEKFYGENSENVNFSLAQYLIKKFGGELTIESDHKQVLTTFLTLPLDNYNEVGSAPSKSNLNVLLIDDEEGILDILSDYVSALGCHFEVATNGVEALRLIRKINFDLLFVDIKMPRMDGYELIEKLIDRYGSNNMPPIVVVSAGGRDQDKILYTQYEPYILQYLDKPFFFEQIADVCQQIAQKKSKKAA